MVELRVWRVAAALMTLIVGCAGIASADETSVGITLNGTTGQHVVRQSAQAVPLVPLPTIDFTHAHKRLRVHAELVPPIGPVQLGSNAPFGYASEPRLSYLSGEVLYGLGRSPISLGIGESVINQRTTYPPTTLVQSSRVVGTRYVGEALAYAFGDQSLVARLALSPSMHGVQYSSVTLPVGIHNPGTVVDPEHGSMVDASLRWTHRYQRGAFSYGLRYINYAAAYDATNQLADRNHLLLPFVSYDVLAMHGQNAGLRSGLLDPKDPPPLAVPQDRTIVGVRLGGASGYRGDTFSDNTESKVSAIVPTFSLARVHGRAELRAQGVLPRSNANVFGAQGNEWSYLTVDGLYRFNRVAVGLGDAVINQRVLNTRSWVSSRSRAEGIRYIVNASLARGSSGNLVADVALTPYLHSLGTTTYARHGPPQTYTSVLHGSLVDASLTWNVPVRTYSFAYGLQYTHKTITYPYPPALAVRDVSLTPFIGFTYWR